MAYIPNFRTHDVSTGNMVIYQNDNISEYLISGAVVLGAPWTLTYTGTPTTGETVRINYGAIITIGIHSIVILGNTLPAGYASKKFVGEFKWTGASWGIKVMPDFQETDVVLAGQLADGAVSTTPEIADSIVTLRKLENETDATLLGNNTGGATYPREIVIATNSLVGRAAANIASIAVSANSVLVRGAANIADTTIAAGSVLGRPTGGSLGSLSSANLLLEFALPSANLYVGSAGGVPTARAITGVIAISNTGVTSFVAGSIANADIAGGAAIVFTKLAAITQGYILTNRGAGNVQYDCSTAGNLLIGDGADITSTPVTGDISISAAGLTAIVASAVHETMLGSQTVVSTTTGTIAGQRMTTAAFRALLTAGTHNLFFLHTGDIILNFTVYVGTVSGVVQTIDIGYDAAVNLEGTGADTNGIIETANSNAAGRYEAIDAAYDGAAFRAGAFTVAADGWITATPTADISASAMVAHAYITYIPA